MTAPQAVFAVRTETTTHQAFPGSRRGKRLPELSFASSAFRDHDVHLITRLVPTCSADPLAPSAARAGVASSHPASVSIVSLLVPGF